MNVATELQRLLAAQPTLRFRLAAPAEGEIVLYGNFGWEITAKEFREELKALGDVERLHLRINSDGGSWLELLPIYNALLEHPAKVIAHIDGVAASAASWVAMAADEIEIPTNGWLMIHNPRIFCIGEAEDLRRTATMLDQIKKDYVDACRRHTSKSAAELATMMDEETWLQGQAAVDAGLATRVVEALEAAASAAIDLTRFRHAPAAALALTAHQQPPADPPPKAKEPQMTKPDKATAPPNDPPADLPPTNTPELSAELAALRAERAAVQQERAVARRERTQAAVERRLTALGSRVTPAMRRAGTDEPRALEQALVELSLLEQAPSLKLTRTQDGQKLEGDVSVVDLVFAALASATSFAAADAGELAGDDAEAGAPLVNDRRTPAQKKLDAQMGIADDKAAELQRRRPSFFNDHGASDPN